MATKPVGGCDSLKVEEWADGVDIPRILEPWSECDLLARKVNLK